MSEERATRWVTDVARRATDDVGNFQKGLPAGAAQLATLFAQGGVPADDLPAVRQGLRRIRVDVPELAHASSTFFALTDAKGIAIRNDLEQDVMAGQDVWKLFPELRKTTEQPFVAAGGLFAGARATGDPDRDWVAATPLKDAHGAFAGMLLGGFTMKRLAIHLTETLRQDLLDEQAKTKDLDKLPITFVSVFDGAGVFSSPSMPEVNHKALVDSRPRGEDGVGDGARRPDHQRPRLRLGRDARARRRAGSGGRAAGGARFEAAPPRPNAWIAAASAAQPASSVTPPTSGCALPTSATPATTSAALAASLFRVLRSRDSSAVATGSVRAAEDTEEH